MAQIPTSNITMTAIATEVGVSTSSISMANLRANSISYVNSGQTNNNVNVAPDNMRDWAGYVHTLEFGNATTYANEGTVHGDIVSYVNHKRTGNEPLVRSANIFFFKLNGTTVEFYVVPDHTQGGIGSLVWETAAFYETYGNSSSYTGNFSSGFTPKKIAQISGDPQGSGSVLSGLTASITKTHLSGVGTQDGSISGYTILSSGATAAPHATTLNALAPQAWAEAACYGSQTRDTQDKIEFKVQATNYVEKSVASFVSRCKAIAFSNQCL